MTTYNMYCVKCKKKVDSEVIEVLEKTRMVKGLCSICKLNTTTFTSKDTIQQLNNDFKKEIPSKKESKKESQKKESQKKEPQKKEPQKKEPQKK